MSRILLVEAHDTLRHALATMLRHMGHEVTAVASGSEALELPERASAEVVLADLSMSDAEALEILGRFHQRDPRLRLIAISARLPRDSGAPFLAAAERIGVRWLLPKPFTAKQLEEVIRAAAAEPLPSPS